MVLASISQRIGLRRRIYTREYFTKDMASLSISSDIEHLSIVRIQDYWLGLHWGRKSRGRVSMSGPTSPSAATVLVTIPSAKEFAAASRGLARWHRKGIQVYLRVISVFLVARLTIRYIESIIYTMFSDVIREATTTAAEFNGVKVYQVILQYQY